MNIAITPDGLAIHCTLEEARRLVIEARHLRKTHANCPALDELLAAWERFDAAICNRPSAEPARCGTSKCGPNQCGPNQCGANQCGANQCGTGILPVSSLPLVRTGPGGDYARDYTPELIGGDKQAALAEASVAPAERGTSKCGTGIFPVTSINLIA